jgi:g-D-glutamyl-meso-diaminopimelate peptidase
MLQEPLIHLALSRAGYANMEAFAAAQGLSLSAAEEALMPWVLGYDLWRVQPGDTFSKIARQEDTTAQAIAVANPGIDPERLQVGRYLVVPFAFDVVPESVPVTWQLCHYILRGLQARYPALQVETIGKSVYGRTLERAQLGQGSRVAYFNAAHHANEWITTLAVLGCLEQYAKAAAFGEQLLGLEGESLLRGTTLYLVPLVNPDGVDLLNGGLTQQERDAAQTIGAQYPDIPFPDGWKANLRGVDLNLNYPALWDEARKIKEAQGFTQPAPRDYVGPEPLSEPESRAMFDTTEALDPDVTIAWHTQGQEIYWKFQDLEPSGARNLGLQMALASGYALEDVPYASGFAGYKDWFIQDFDRPGYTVEAGSGENPLPLGQLPEIIRENLPIFLLGLSGGDPNFQPPGPTQTLARRPEAQIMRPPTWG